MDELEKSSGICGGWCRGDLCRISLRAVRQTPEGNVDAIFLPATAGGDGVPKPAMIFGHGNGEVIDDWLTAFGGFRQRGIGVLLVGPHPSYFIATSTAFQQSSISRVRYW
jgi:hypothetical protein